MAVTQRPFESEFGFKSPGFTVDALGNITATSINAAGAGGGGTQTGDYSVTTTGGNFRISSNTVIVDAGDNPTITLRRGTTYSFSLDISAGSFNLFDGSNVLYNTGIQHQSDTDVISTGAAAQAQTSGTFTFEVPGSAPDLLYYGDADYDPKGTINVEDPIAVNISASDLTVTGTSTMQAVTATELTLNGNGTVTGTFEVEGTLTANSLNIDGLGVAEMNAGTNIVLSAGNAIEFKVDSTTKGIIGLDGSTLRVIDTTIDNTVIGGTEPSTATFSEASVLAQPTTKNQISNKVYTDNTATALAVALGI